MHLLTYKRNLKNLRSGEFDRSDFSSNYDLITETLILIILYSTRRNLDPVIFNVSMEALSLYEGHCLFSRTNLINQEIFYLYSKQ
jgi:hypothetical protein